MNKANYPQLKVEAVQLRKKGLSYNEISKQTGISKGTLSFWLKDVPLTLGQRKKLYTKSVLALTRGPQCQKERREREVAEITEKAKKEIRLPLSSQTYRFVGAALYWAEGGKTGDFNITNADPAFILFMIRWLEKVLGVPPTQLKAKLNIYSQQNEQTLKRFWSDLTGIPLDNFNKSFVKPPNKGYKKNNLYYGTIKIRVIRGTDFRYRVHGWIKVLLEDIAPEAEAVGKKWKSLKETPRPINLPLKQMSRLRSSIGRASGS